MTIENYPPIASGPEFDDDLVRLQADAELYTSAQPFELKDQIDFLRRFWQRLGLRMCPVADVDDRILDQAMPDKTDRLVIAPIKHSSEWNEVAISFKSVFPKNTFSETLDPIRVDQTIPKDLSLLRFVGYAYKPLRYSDYLDIWVGEGRGVNDGRNIWVFTIMGKPTLLSDVDDLSELIANIDPALTMDSMITRQLIKQVNGNQQTSNVAEVVNEYVVASPEATAPQKLIGVGYRDGQIQIHAIQPGDFKQPINLRSAKNGFYRS